MQSLWRGIDTDSTVRRFLAGRCNRAPTRLAVRARSAGPGQDQVVDELALSNLSDGRSIDQAEFFAYTPRGRRGRFLLRLQFMFNGAGSVGDDGHRDENARGHRCCTYGLLRGTSATSPARADAVTIYIGGRRGQSRARVRGTRTASGRRHRVD